MIFKCLNVSPRLFGGLSLALALCLSPAAQAQPAPEFVTVNGTAAYLQRIAMPPDAVLTVQLQDISRADARATVLGESSEAFGRRQVPLAYSIKVRRSAIDPRMRYAVRASISVDGEMQFATTRHYPVLTHGAPHQLDLVLQAVPEAGGPSAAAPSLRFALPATFAGLLPCADCRGIAHTLTLQPDGSYRLRRTDLGKPGEPVVEAGRWTADQRGQRLALHDGAGNTLYFSARTDGVLRRLDRNGHAIRSSLSMDLRRTAKIDPFDQAARADQPQATSATLQDSYWKLVELQGKPVTLLAGQEREVRITLASPDQRLMGFSGCNALGGSYVQNGTSLKFEKLASSMRLCEPALNALERQVLAALAASKGQRIDGQRLSLLAGAQVLARFEAVYLK